jgi:DNA polymerase-3 subunit gamma/tau
MTRRLKEICQAEEAKLSDRALSLLVRQSDGGMRDALSLLDQVLSACGREPSDEEVAEALGAIDRTLVQAFAEALVRRDARALLRKTEESYDKGIDIERLAKDLALQLRHLVVARALGEAPRELAESEQQTVLALSREADAAQLTRLFDVVHECIPDLGTAAEPRLAFEMALLRAVQLAPAASIPELIAKVEKLAAGGSVTGSPSLGASGGRSASAPFRT